MPGKIASCGDDLQEVLGVVEHPAPGRHVGREAEPRNESADSVMIAAPTPSVAATMTGLSTFGRMCLKMIDGVLDADRSAPPRRTPSP